MRLDPTAEISPGVFKCHRQRCHVSANSFKASRLRDYFKCYWQFNSIEQTCYGQRVKRAAFGSFISLEKTINMERKNETFMEIIGGSVFLWSGVLFAYWLAVFWSGSLSTNITNVSICNFWYGRRVDFC